LHLASNPAVVVKMGVMLAGIARLGYLFGTCLTDGWERGAHVSDAPESTCIGELKAVKKDGAVGSKPIEASMSGIFDNLNAH
jgi:hypothetical protein